MSDASRKDLSTKTKEAIIPDAMKSDTQKAKEAVTGSADHIAREGQSDTSKSTVQETMDKTGRAKDETKHDSNTETIGDKIKQAVGLDKKEHDNTTAGHTTHTN